MTAVQRLIVVVALAACAFGTLIGLSRSQYTFHTLQSIYVDLFVQRPPTSSTYLLSLIATATPAGGKHLKNIINSGAKGLSPHLWMLLMRMTHGDVFGRRFPSLKDGGRTKSLQNVMSPKGEDICSFSVLRARMQCNRVDMSRLAQDGRLEFVSGGLFCLFGI